MIEDENPKKHEDREIDTPDNLKAIAKALMVNLAWSLADLGGKHTDKEEGGGKQEKPLSK